MITASPKNLNDFHGSAGVSKKLEVDGTYIPSFWGDFQLV